MSQKEAPRPRVDVHTHLGLARTHVNDPLLTDSVRAWGTLTWDVTPEQHRSACRATEATVVVAFDAEPVGVVVPNYYVGEYVRQSRDLIGFASVNPNRPNAQELLTEAVEDFGLRGLKLGPTYQHFHPSSAECFSLLEVADQYNLPVLWHQGTTFVRNAVLEFAPPILLDAVARRFPDLHMWIAHLGHPWCEEAAATIRKHEHMYADVSALTTRPFQLYRALTAFSEYGVLDRVLFGTDFPFSTIEPTVQSLLAVNRIAAGTGLPVLAEDELLAIIERDSLTLLGLTEC